MPPAIIRYQLTEEEVVRGFIKNLPGRRRIMIGTVLVLLGVLELVLGAHTHSSLGGLYMGVGGVFVAGGLLLVLLMPKVYRLAYVKVVRANPSFTAAKEISFDEDRLTSSSTVQQLEVPWAAFRRLPQDERYFYLHLDFLGNVSLLPKSAFDEASLQSFLKCSLLVPRA